MELKIISDRYLHIMSILIISLIITFYKELQLEQYDYRITLLFVIVLLSIGMLLIKHMPGVTILSTILFCEHVGAIMLLNRLID